MAKITWLLLGLLIWTFAYPPEKLFGQAVYGSIVGTVMDTSHAVVPDAKITITD